MTGGMIATNPRGGRSIRKDLAALVIALGIGLAIPLSVAADTWGVIKSPNVGAGDNILESIACAGTECVAVGAFVNDSGEYQTLIEENTGSGWVVAPSPNTGPGTNILQGVTCISAGDCWAVGYYVDASGMQHGLVEHETGSQWTIVSSPSSAARPDILYGVTCAAADHCWAVGYHPFRPDQGIYRTLVEEYTGNGWTIVGSPNPGTAFNVLQNVACAGASDCWAVGYRSSGGVSQNLIERNTGSGWVTVTSANTSPTQNNQLNSVTCSSASHCWAVGYYDKSGGGAFRTLTEESTGSGWVIVSSPDFGTDVSNVLQGVTCASATTCWAVGWYFSGVYQALIEENTGGGWAIVTSPTVGALGNLLNGVSCAGASGCWSAGYYRASNTGSRTLIEHSSGAGGADLAMNLRAASTATVGHNLTYHLHVANRGPSDASDVHVHFSLPGGTTFVAASANGQLDANKDSVRWRLPGLASGEAIVLTVTLTMDEVKSMRAFASAHALAQDPNSANDSSSVLTKVTPAI